MNAKQQAHWQQIRARGRTDFALRRGVTIGFFLWAGLSFFGNWSGWRELVLSLPFYICMFIAFEWFVMWPWRERDYLRVLKESSEPPATSA